MASLPSLVAERSYPLFTGLVFLVTSPYPEALLQSPHSYKHWRITKDTPSTQEILRVLGTQCQDPGTEINFLLLLLCYMSSATILDNADLEQVTTQQNLQWGRET